MAEYFKTYINRHCGELDDEVFPILAKHTEWWGDTTAKDLLHTSMYDILDEDGNLLGFFGNSLWNHGGELECVLCTAYVKPEYRGIGLFNKMVKYTIEHNTEAKTVVIGAMDGNELANTIYSRKFAVMYHDDEERGTWYMIKDRRGKRT